MPAGDVTLTRGVGFRDDGLDASLWSATQTANVSALFGGDGDILSLTVTFFNAVSGNNGKATRSITGGPSTTTYPKVIIRHKDNGIGANADLTMTVGYSDATSSTFALAKTGSYPPPETFSLTAGKTVNSLEVKIQANTSIIAASYTVDWDFIFIFKETLTLPAVSKPLQLSLPECCLSPKIAPPDILSLPLSISLILRHTLQFARPAEAQAVFALLPARCGSRTASRQNRRALPVSSPREN
jgi:hypothetical protein